MIENRKVPILRLNSTLIVSIQWDLGDSEALDLKDNLAREIVKWEASGVIIDVSAIEIMDSYIARVINDMGSNSLLMGARTVLVGLKPAIAITLVEMGMEMDGVETALNLERGLERIASLGQDTRDEAFLADESEDEIFRRDE